MDPRTVETEPQRAAPGRLRRHLIGLVAALVLTPIAVWLFARAALDLDPVALLPHPQGRTFEGGEVGLLVMALVALGLLVLSARISPLGPVLGGVLTGIVPWCAFVLDPQGVADLMRWAGPQMQWAWATYLEISALPLGAMLIASGLAVAVPRAWGRGRLGRWPTLAGLLGLVVVLAALLAIGDGLAQVRAHLAQLASGPWPTVINPGLALLAGGVLCLWALAAVLGRVGVTLWLPGAVLLVLGAGSLLTPVLYDLVSHAGDRASAAAAGTTPCLALALGAVLLVAGHAGGRHLAAPGQL